MSNDVDLYACLTSYVFISVNYTNFESIIEIVREGEREREREREREKREVLTVLLTWRELGGKVLKSTT